MLLSGQQIEISSGAQRAVITTVGATLRSYVVGGESEIIDGFDADQVCPDGRGQILMPWPNRVEGGRYSFAAVRHQLAIDEPELGHAIHGLARWAEWRVERHALGVARFGHRLCAQPGYPFAIDLSAEYRFTRAGLAVTLGATNRSAAPCPFGMGAHPYFAFAGVPADEVELCVPAEEWLPLDASSIPRCRRPTGASDMDFRRVRLIGTARLDHAFARLERREDGRARVLLRRGAKEIRVWLDRTFDFVQIFTGDTLPDRGRRRRGIAVEPMTCAPNAFNSGDGLRVLAPDEAIAGRFGVEVSS